MTNKCLTFTASDAAPLQYLAPYSGCAMGEYFRCGLIFIFNKPHYRSKISSRQGCRSTRTRYFLEVLSGSGFWGSDFSINDIKKYSKYGSGQKTRMNTNPSKSRSVTIAGPLFYIVPFYCNFSISVLVKICWSAFYYKENTTAELALFQYNSWSCREYSSIIVPI